MGDPYDILVVPRTASQDDIKKAYLKLAKKLHPDLNPGDAKIELQFKEASGAYDLLSDAEKRARFDRGEIDSAGNERADQSFWRSYAESGPGTKYETQGGFDPSDLFSALFGDRRGRAGARGARKGVVSGKSVSVRVDHGGRRIIK